MTNRTWGHDVLKEVSIKHITCYIQYAVLLLSYYLRLIMMKGVTMEQNECI